jgi:hypothetical protein
MEAFACTGSSWCHRPHLRALPSSPTASLPKVLDIEAGAHFTVAIVMNVSGDGCTLDGLKTGHKCVVINPDNGLTEQDWDIPRNIDVRSAPATVRPSACCAELYPLLQTGQGFCSARGTPACGGPAPLTPEWSRGRWRGCTSGARRLTLARRPIATASRHLHVFSNS